jgi:hypothetical protein
MLALAGTRKFPELPFFAALSSLTGLGLRVKILCNRLLEFHWGSRGSRGMGSHAGRPTAVRRVDWPRE